MKENMRKGRVRQKRRTRRALMQAATHLISTTGKSPTMAEIAQEAETSVATAYRYFSSTELVLASAAVDLLIPPIDEVMPDNDGTAVERVLRLEEMVNSRVLENELAAYTFIRTYAHEWTKQGLKNVPDRPGRRIAMIEEALRPFRKALGKDCFHTLANALALTMGSESVIVTRTIGHLEPEQSREITAWAATALVKQAFAEANLEP